MSESLGEISPFEVMTGARAKTVADGFLCTGPASGKVDIGSIRAAAAEFTRIARANADYNRMHTVEVMNKHGRVLKSLIVGDHVKIYAPPGHKEAVRRNRKQKHMHQWRGPMEIVEKPSDRRFKLRNIYNHKKTYERNIINVRKWVGPIPDKEPQDDVDNDITYTDFEVGDLVMARDTESSKEFDLAEIMKITDTDITLGCFGTRGKKTQTAKFYPVYTHKSDVYLGKFPRKVKAKRWTWTIQASDLTELVPIRGMELNKNKTLTAKALSKFKKYGSNSKMRRFG